MFTVHSLGNFLHFKVRAISRSGVGTGCRLHVLSPTLEAPIRSLNHHFQSFDRDLTTQLVISLDSPKTLYFTYSGGIIFEPRALREVDLFEVNMV
jgi:hypothetical protein